MALTKVKNSTDQVYKTVAAMKATTAVLGDHVRTLGYYSSGDGGGAHYTVVKASEYTGSPDEIGDHTLNSGKIAVLSTSCPVHPKSFGAVGDGVADDRAALLAADSVGPIKLQDGTYRIASNTTFVNEVSYVSGGSLSVDSAATVTLSGNKDQLNVRLFGVEGSVSNPDESEGIQKALSSGVSEIYVPSGTYNLQVVLRIPSNTTLIASKNAIFRRNGTLTALIINDSAGTTGGYTANENITISGGQWQANFLDFPSTQGSLISFAHCTNIKVEDVVCIEMVNGAGVRLSGCKDCLVLDCVFKNASAFIFTSGVGIAHDASSSTFSFFGPYDSTATRNVRVQNCQFDEMGGGIKTITSGATVLPSDITVSDCTFSALDREAVYLVNVSNSKIINNYISDCAEGIDISYDNATNQYSVLVSGNIISDMNRSGDKKGIYISGFSLATKNIKGVTVSNNTVNDVGAKGIEIKWAQNVIVDGNITTNTITNGIHVYGVGDFSIVNNISRLCSSFDLTVGTAGSVDTIQGTVVGNTADVGYISYCHRVIGRNNTFFTSLANTVNTQSAVSENLIAGVLV